MKQLQDFRKNYHYANDIETIYGQENGIYFSVSPLERSNMVRATFSVTDPDNLVDSIQAMRSRFDALPMGGVYTDEGLLYVEMNTVNIDDDNVFHNIISTITEIIAQSSTNRDQVTHATGNLGMFRVGTKVRIINDESYKEEKEIAAPHKTKSPIVAWLMAIVGMLGGVVIWVLLGQIRIISGIAGFFIIKWGVQQFVNNGGDLHRRNAIILLVMSFAMMVGAELSAYIIEIMKIKTIVPLPFFTVISIAFQAMLQGQGLINLLVGLGFSVWSSWGLIQSLINNTPIEANKPVKRKNNRLL